MKSVTVEMLAEFVKESTVELEVFVPDRDYYARRSDFTRETIYYIDANKLLNLLTKEE